MKINGIFLLIYINLANLIKLYLCVDSSLRIYVKLSLDLTKSPASDEFEEKWRYAIDALLCVENGRLSSTYAFI